MWAVSSDLVFDDFSADGESDVLSSEDSEGIVVEYALQRFTSS